MDKRKSILNVTVSMFFKIVTIVMSIAVKRFLIDICGNEVNGLNALYISIIGFLAVAELGVGSAITFCMYKPIVNGDIEKVSALYRLFNRLYLIIGGIIFTVGLGITPFIKFFAKDYAKLDVNLYVTFVLMLISVVVTYLFGSKTALINAYKNNYITTAITSGGIVFQYILQIIVLLTTKSFVGYLVCRIASSLAQWLATEIIVRKKHAAVLIGKHKVDSETKHLLVRNIKAMFMHKIGTLLVNTVDGIVISAFVGVIALGEYSNYTTLLTSLTGILALAFSSLTSIFGHLYVESDKETAQKYCETFHLINFLMGTIFFLGYYAVADNLISILFSADLVVEKSISFVITLNGFVHFMRQSTLAFKDATGTFYNDRFKPLIEGATNIVLSVVLVKFIGVTGVIIATIITNLVICHIIEPYVVYKNAFLTSPKKYYFKNYGMILVFTLALTVTAFLLKNISNQWFELIVNGLLSVGVSAVACTVVIIFNKGLFLNIVRTLKKRR